MAPGRSRSVTIIGLAAVLLAHVAVLTLPATPLRAESDLQAEETDENINRAVKSLKDDEREKAKAQGRLKALQQQHKALELKKRTKPPFRSERDLRHDLKRNDAQQGWQKREANRLEFESRQQQQDINNQIETWRRK